MDKIAIIGLGYVGLPLAHAFSFKYKVVGFDIAKWRIEELKKGYDRTLEVSEEELKEATEKCLSCKVLGDIVISLERAFYQSKEYEITLKEEIKRLLVHGLVHLLGFDHEINEIPRKSFSLLKE